MNLKRLSESKKDKKNKSSPYDFFVCYIQKYTLKSYDSFVQGTK